MTKNVVQQSMKLQHKVFYTIIYNHPQFEDLTFNLLLYIYNELLRKRSIDVKLAYFIICVSSFYKSTIITCFVSI